MEPEKGALVKKKHLPIIKLLPSCIHLKATEVQAQQEEEVHMFPHQGKAQNWGAMWRMERASTWVG